MKGEISGSTVVCGVIGDPVEHSMSPVMHNAAYKVLDLDYTYAAFRVKSGDLGKAIQGMRALNVRGLNVTIPHKVEVMSYLDNIDPLAQKIGAVNAIVNDDGTLTGYNTDATGFLQALAEKAVEPSGKKVVLLGAGGAARAIGFALAENGAHLVILNRKEEPTWAEDLARRIGNAYNVPVASGELDRSTVKYVLPADIIVNATSVGMTPNTRQSPFPPDLFCSGMVAFDAVYNPFQTQFLKEARAAGAQTIDGLEMLVWQGALAFNLWTGRQAPVEVMRQAAMRILKV